ncbi:MAG: aldo/keto reductase [Oscillospiraceae bacterium]|jgi:predicted aldo/keto reductase-like oxidoreductase|nr:aldo/keto reductase [Oscillospiraceae bacterium]
MLTLGKTGITTQKNAFGALPVQRISLEAAVYLLRKAYDNGFTYFDTAAAYSDSELKLGAAFGDIRRDSFVIATKTMSADADGFWKQLHNSLKTLRTDYIDIYQFHNPGVVPRPGDAGGLYDAMLEAKAQGKIRHISLTNHRADIAEEAVKSGLYDTLQFPFSYLSGERDLALVELCKAHNVGFIAMKALSGGLITNSAAAYAYLDKFDNVLPIWGIQRESELDEFIAHAKNPPALTEALQSEIDRDRAELAGNFCRGCGYCMPTCPAQIQISTAARMSQLIRRSPSATLLTDFGQNMMKQINNCVDCGECKKHCPYDLDTPALLKRNLADYEAIIAGKTVI